MIRLLAYTSPARGHLYPIVPVLLELRHRGHEIALRTLASHVELMRGLGIDAGPTSGRIERVELDDYKERSKAIRGIRALETFLARAEHEAPDLRAAIDRFDPDVLLVDINCWGAATVAEASGRPWAMYSPYLLPLPSRDAPPFGLGLPPLGGPLGWARDAIVDRVASALLDRVVVPELGALRARHGLPRLDRYSDLFVRPPLLLALTAEGFEYPRSDWPANVRLVGPMNWAPPAQAAAWLADTPDPLVLVTCSTDHQRDKRLVHVALEALPVVGMSVIATTAAHDPLAFDAPPGSKVIRFVPHEAVLERAVCVVCHGGMGITQKALAAGVPVVVVPFGRDQLETARRVEVAEAGVRLSPRRLTPDRLADAVRTAIDRRAGAQRVSRAYATAGGQAAAADAIEAISRGQRQPSVAQMPGR
ncbi:MAG TPA: glycosyltransferase [Solirubrobacteraceae bacterium]|nr:glycosyltransferase [Solirubrobacteraceae bacterium]